MFHPTLTDAVSSFFFNQTTARPHGEDANLFQKGQIQKRKYPRRLLKLLNQVKNYYGSIIKKKTGRTVGKLFKGRNVVGGKKS